jgi:hypothetical protein
MTEVMLRPDAKGRVALGELGKGVTNYKVSQLDNGQLIFTPYTEIPFSDKWVFDKPDLLEQFKQYVSQNQSE